MSSQKLSIDQPAEPTDSTEARMRLALGLTTRPPSSGHGHAPTGGAISHDSTRQRRRFAQDGDVPVVILNRSRDGDAAGENKLAALTAELREERNARMKAERAQEEANLAIQSLQTKLAHTEMTYEERLRDERETRVQLETRLLNEQEARKRVETKAAESALAFSVLERKLAAATEAANAIAEPDLFEEPALPVAAPKTSRVSPVKRVARKTKAETKAEPTLPLAPEPAREEDDKPIEWWLPSFRASRKTPTRRKSGGR